MKRRVALALCTCFFLNSGLPLAAAASWESQLADVGINSANVNARIQEVLQVQQLLEDGKREELIDILTAAAIAKTQQTYGIPVIPGENIQDTVRQTAQQYIAQRMQGEITEKTAPYKNIMDTIGLLQQLNSKLNPQAVEHNGDLASAPANYQQILKMTATAYAPGSADNASWEDKNHVGTKVRKGVVATDPNVIPMGTKLWIEGYGYAVAEDQGSAIKGNRIDLAFDDFETADEYGIQIVKVYVLN